jgi:membrane protease YdiL (CAAX protease family)
LAISSASSKGWGLRNWQRIGVVVSAAIRLSYHTYQGPVSALAIGAMGVAFAGLYMRWRNLWIFAFAHMQMDFLALLPHSQE